VELAERAEPLLGFGGPHEGAWLQRLEAEHDNLRGPLDGAVATGQAEVGLRLAGALQPFWMRQGHMEEGRQRLEAVLALPGASEATTHRAKALRAAGWHAFHQNEPAKLPFLDESLAIERQLGNKRGVAASLFLLGPVACDRRDRKEALRFLEESLALYRELGDPSRIAWCLENLGAAQNDPEQGRALLNESMAIQRKLGNRLSLAWSSWQLGHLAWRQGDREAALRCYREGLALHRELNHRYGVAIALQSMGKCLIAQRDWESARSALEEAEAFFQEIGKKGNRINSLLGLGTAAYHQAVRSGPEGTRGDRRPLAQRPAGGSHGAPRRFHHGCTHSDGRGGLRGGVGSGPGDGAGRGHRVRA
jgi:tetratricopeptide (TPR) repeat protein